MSHKLFLAEVAASDALTDLENFYRDRDREPDMSSNGDPGPLAVQIDAPGVFASLPAPVREFYNATDQRQDSLTSQDLEFREAVDEYVGTENADTRAMIADYLSNLLICIERGHDFSGDGYEGWANADTGGEDFNCQRCGFSFDVTYY